MAMKQRGPLCALRIGFMLCKLCLASNHSVNVTLDFDTIINPKISEKTCGCHFSPLNHQLFNVYSQMVYGVCGFGCHGYAVDACVASILPCVCVCVPACLCCLLLVKFEYALSFR